MSHKWSNIFRHLTLKISYESITGRFTPRICWILGSSIEQIKMCIIYDLMAPREVIEHIMTKHRCNKEHESEFTGHLAVFI